MLASYADVASANGVHFAEDVYVWVPGEGLVSYAHDERADYCVRTSDGVCSGSLLASRLISQMSSVPMPLLITSISMRSVHIKTCHRIPPPHVRRTFYPAVSRLAHVIVIPF